MNYKEKPKSTNEMAGLLYLLIITLNVNGLNAPVKDIEWPNGYEKKALNISFLQKNSFLIQKCSEMKCGNGETIPGK